jgi:transposase
MRVHLEVRRFLCRTRTCPRTTFTERFPRLSRAYGRRTLRQADALTEVAFAVGGKAGARLAMPTSRDTLLRLIRSTALPQHETPRVLGLDDFAWKKGDRYGTLLVDLEVHAPVEMLPDREAATVARWLRAHRGVKLISRDRAGAYAEGAKRGAPRARQIADRYHVLVNLRDTLKDTLARHQSALPVLEGDGRKARVASQPTAELPEVSPIPIETPQAEERADGQQGRWTAADPYVLTAVQRRRQIVTLFRQGLSQREVARQLHVSRQVVHRFVTAETFPERVSTGRRQSKLDPYLPYLRQRWEQGCHNGLQLARELPAQGFRGSASLVGKLLGDWRARLPGPPERVRGKKRQAAPPVKRRLSARQASWLFE